MKKIVCLLFNIIFILSLNMAWADEIRTSGLYTYKIKGNGTITITKFDWDNNKENIYIPNMIDGYNVTGIENEAFAKSEYIEKTTYYSVTIPTGITMIGDKAFMNAPIAMVNIPKNVQKIGAGAFANCALSQFSVEPGNEVYTTIDGALYNKKEKMLVAWPKYAENKEKIPDGILKIEDYAFYGSVNLILLMDDFIPETVEEIGNYAFANVTRMFIKKKFLDGNLRKIGNYAFANCEKFQLQDNVIIGNKNLDIGEGAFENVTIKIDYEDQVGLYSKSDETRKANFICARKIGKCAFRNMGRSGYGRIRLMIDDSVEEIEDEAFSGSSCCDLMMTTESNLKVIGKGAFQNGKALAQWVEVMSYNEDNGHYIKCGTFETPNKLKEIADYSFSSAFTNDQNVFFPTLEVSEGIQRIGKGAFEKNEYVLYVNLPQTLNEIGEGAFEGCTKLEKLVFKENSAINKIGKNAFKNCPYLTSIVIPSSVTEIGDNAFDKGTITLQVEQGSYAALWASENGYSYQYSDAEEDTSWLNN